MAKNKTVKFFLLVALALFSGRGLAAESDSIALYGSPKYGGGWQHFDYADPDARKGGRVVLPAYGTFDNFNPFIFNFEILLKNGVSFAIINFCGKSRIHSKIFKLWTTTSLTLFR